MHGSYAANMALVEADYIINLGSRFDDRVVSNPAKFAKNAVVAHIDIDAAELGKIVKTDIPILSDLKAALSRLLQLNKVRTDFNELSLKIKRKHHLLMSPKTMISVHRKQLN